MTLGYQPERHELLQVMRQRHHTAQAKDLIDRDVALEALSHESSLTVTCAMHVTRLYKKTHLLKMSPADVTNILRFICWLNEITIAKTRTSLFAAHARL